MVERQHQSSSSTRRLPGRELDERTLSIIALGFGLVVPVGLVLFAVWSGIG